MITDDVKWNLVDGNKCWARANDKFYLSVLLAQYSCAKMVKRPPLVTTPTVTISAVLSVLS